MKVELPTQFDVEYPIQNRKYYSAYSKPKIARKLYNSCQGYCMYCGKTTQIEGDRNFHLEHSVDKGGNEYQVNDSNEPLKHCKFNLAIACSECNTVCKKVVDKISLGKYLPLSPCPKKCSTMCAMYLEIRESYMKKNAIILQPQGKEKPIRHLISYNLLKHIYEPDCPDGHDDVRFFIQNHIDRFELNGRRFSPCIIDICYKLVLWYENGIDDFNCLMDTLACEKHENILGIKFAEFVKSTFADQELNKLIDFCRLLVVLEVLP